MIRHQFNGRLNEEEQRRLNTVGLSDEEILRKAPSAFATAAHVDTSDRYTFIPTSQIIAGMRANGFLPVSATESLVRIPERRGFSKHMIRFRQAGANLTQVGDSLAEIIATNAHDGTSCYILGLGAFRLACTNGLMVAEGMFQSVRIRHTGNIIDDVVNSAFDLMKQVPRLADVITRWRMLPLAEPRQIEFATAVHQLRFPKIQVHDAEGNVIREEESLLGQAIPAAKLLEARRYDDRGDDLWHVFNRVQENAVRGQRGLALRGADNVRRVRSSREIKGVDQNVNLNQGIWSIAEKMAERASSN